MRSLEGPYKVLISTLVRTMRGLGGVNKGFEVVYEGFSGYLMLPSQHTTSNRPYEHRIDATRSGPRQKVGGV